MRSLPFRPLFILTALLSSLISTPAFPEDSPAELLARSPRILFLGDSITADGRYVAWFDTWLLSRRITPAPFVINAGLSSETVSGLSEEGHAGGKFPRPHLMERLDRVLAMTRPHLVIACYGMNCGIYSGFHQERFSQYQQGIRQLKAKVEQTRAHLILVTPPVYDDQQAPLKFSYNSVLDRYSDWLLEQRRAGWNVVDLHRPMTAELHGRRQQNPKYTFQPDGVHPNDAGLWFITQQLIRYFGDDASARTASPQALAEHLHFPAEVLTLVRQRDDLLRNAYVAAAGHQRPGVAAGLPIPAAEVQAAQLTAKIHHLVAPQPVKSQP